MSEFVYVINLHTFRNKNVDLENGFFIEFFSGEQTILYASLTKLPDWFLFFMQLM
jgi:hypothetical protein